MQYFIKIAGNGYPGSFVTLNRPRFTIPVGTASEESKSHQNMNIPPVPGPGLSVFGCVIMYA